MGLREELLKTKKELTQLKFQSEQTTMEIPRLKVDILVNYLVPFTILQSRIEDLLQYIEVLRAAMANIRTSGQVLCNT